MGGVELKTTVTRGALPKVRSFQVSVVKTYAVCGGQLRSAKTGILP